MAEQDAPPRRFNLYSFLLPFNGHRDGVAASETQRGHSAMDVAPDHLVDQRDEHARAARADGMSEGDRAAVYVYLRGVESKLVRPRPRLHAEGVVERQEVHVFGLPSGLRPDLA